MSVHEKSNIISYVLAGYPFSSVSKWELVVSDTLSFNSVDNPSIFSIFIDSEEIQIDLRLESIDGGLYSCSLIAYNSNGDKTLVVMPVLIVAGFLVVGTNSYVDVPYAMIYHAAKFNSTKWLNASIESKERSLVSACSMLEAYNWVGDSDSTTPISWPRIIDGTSYTPTGIKDAQCELAAMILDGYSMSMNATNFRIGNFSVSSAGKKVTDLPIEVFNKIKPFISMTSKLVRT